MKDQNDNFKARKHKNAMDQNNILALKISSHIHSLYMPSYNNKFERPTLTMNDAHTNLFLFHAYAPKSPL